MQINRQQLSYALERVKPGLASKEVIEQSTSFAFLDGRVITYNDEISVSHPVEGLELEGAIVADTLYKFLSKIKKEDIEIQTKGSEIIFVSGRTRAGLTLISEVKLPLKEDISQRGKWKALPENFSKHVGFAMNSCGKDMSKPVLTCVSVKQSGMLYATDQYRICKCDMKEEMLVKDFLLPASSAVEVVKLKPNKVAEGKGWMHFQNEEETIISCRVMEDSYPEIDKHLIVKGEKIVLPKTINEVLDRAMVFAKRDHMLDEMVGISIADMKFTVSAKGEGGSGWFEEDVNFKYDGKPVAFSITPYLLKGILSETQACILSKDKLKFEGEDWLYVTLLRG
jgi:hypothetical protein